VGVSVSRYTSRRPWRPLGAAADASWSIDSDDSGFEKMESGFNATARHYARLGLLYLHHGRWNGRRTVPSAWVRAVTRRHTPTKYGDPYGYFWWVDGAMPQRFYAFGNLGQYVYVAPDADTGSPPRLGLGLRQPRLARHLSPDHPGSSLRRRLRASRAGLLETGLEDQSQLTTTTSTTIASTPKPSASGRPSARAAAAIHVAVAAAIDAISLMPSTPKPLRSACRTIEPSRSRG
jgi:hypothetical protein